MKQTLRIIRPSSREQKDILSSRLPMLEQCGFEVLYEDLELDDSWAYTSGTAESRSRALIAALTEPESDTVICARGGYGASDLLPLIPWSKLKQVRPKLLVGFSDISALHCGLYAQLGWPSMHAPMPATVLWDQSTPETSLDLQALFANLQQWDKGSTSGSLPLTAIGDTSPHSLTGKLFGGCFTVLTNLIGTPYFPKSLAGHIVFIEDTDEHPARLMRAFNQWLQSDALIGASALVIGHLRNLGQNIPDCAEFVLKQFAQRSPIPVFHTPLFGHSRPNYPLMIGASGQITQGRLTWHMDRDSLSPNSTRGANT
ncbi:MAG: LD-carboxypeptidase [Proteobacteria bacterium]|nr:LD-carboxypeptidase [Pseudomonadota bacterium]